MLESRSNGMREAGGASDRISTTDPEPIPTVMSEDTSWHYPSAELWEHAPTIWAERSGTPLLLELKSNSNDSGHVRVVPYRPCSILSSISPIISHLVDPLSSDTSLSPEQFRFFTLADFIYPCMYQHGTRPPPRILPTLYYLHSYESESWALCQTSYNRGPSS